VQLSLPPGWPAARPPPARRTQRGAEAAGGDAGWVEGEEGRRYEGCVVEKDVFLKGGLFRCYRSVLCRSIGC